MKRQFILFFLFVFPFALQADRYTDMAAKHLEWVKAGQVDSLLAHADAQLRAVLPASSIRTIWGQLTAQTGALKNQHEWKREHKDGLELATCLLEFEKARVDYRAVFNAQGQLSGISFTPAPLTASPNMQPEVPVKPLPDDVKEQDFTIKHNGVSLPGKLMMPCKTQAQTQWPVVILVHGSGPQNMDETLGPNKPFRDLAIALAQRGIATVRYDKRTKVYAQRTAEVSKGILNYDTETVDDALQALRQAARLPQIDTDRIYVLGHSMGGTLMPRIALRSELKIAGLIGMAAAARPFDEMLYDQVKYLSIHAGLSADSAAARARSFVKQMTDVFPPEYKAMQKSYDPLQAVKKLKNKPMLFLQGTHDYQVTEADLELWRQAVSNNPHVQMVLLTGLDHLMRELPAMATPDDYAQPGEMDKSVIDMIAHFVHTKGKNS